jgi:hypothetical protein
MNRILSAFGVLALAFSLVGPTATVAQPMRGMHSCARHWHWVARHRWHGQWVAGHCVHDKM